MLSIQENERLTSVGPGTPMGELMRRYWHPVAASVELKENPTKAVRILGENLVLYKDRSGQLGLIQEACPHRRVNLLYGIPEEHGLRCPYHGWVFDETGRCLEQPAEAPDSTFKDRVTAVTYPVEELGGLIWAYLGPEPAPLLPRWDLLVEENVLREIAVTVLPCNWLQCMENSLDPVHVEWLHTYQSHYVLEREGHPEARQFKKAHHAKIGFDVFEHGIYKRRYYEGGSEEDETWTNGHPIIFPVWLRSGATYHMRIPMDDTHTTQYIYAVYYPPNGVKVPPQEEIRAFELPYRNDTTGRAAIEFTVGQDMMAWWTQGPLAERSKEMLAESDKGIILYRRLLQAQMQLVQNGGDPMNTFRDPAGNTYIRIEHEGDPRVTPRTSEPRAVDQRRMIPMSGQMNPVTGQMVPIANGAGTGHHSVIAELAKETFDRLAARQPKIEQG